MLNLSLEECTAINEIQPIRVMISNLPKLNTLEMNFSSLTEVNDEQLKILSAGIASTKVLKKAFIKFPKMLGYFG
jgi:hypothetical protein